MKGPVKKYPPVQTSGARGVGVSKSGSAGARPVQVLPKVAPPVPPRRAPPVPPRKAPPVPSRRAPGLKGKLGGLPQLGVGLAGGMVGEILAGELKKGRRPGNEEVWSTVDTISDILSFGTGFTNPLVAGFVGPFIEGVAQLGMEGARQGAVPGSMGLPTDDAEFLEYVVKNKIELPTTFEEQDKMKKEFLAWRDRPKEEVDEGYCEPVYEDEEVEEPSGIL